MVSIEMGLLAPIGVFIYNRPTHTANALSSLRACPEFEESPLFIYCDGPKNSDNQETISNIAKAREAARKIAPKNAIFIERDSNFGLSRSIIQGVTRLCDQFGQAIVVEDDLEVAPGFLTFLNQGLERYRDVESVFQISGYQFPVPPLNERGSLFLSFPTSWGWATWKRAWTHFDESAQGYFELLKDFKLRDRFDLNGSYPYYKMLESQMNRKIDSWAIRWYLSCFLAGSLTLYPARSLVQNKGMDGSGTHGDHTGAFRTELAAGLINGFPTEVKVNLAAQETVEKYLAHLTSSTLVSRTRRFGERFFK